MKSMVSTIVFLLMHRLVAVAGLGGRPDEKDVEIAALCHQLNVLRRQLDPTHHARRRDEISDVKGSGLDWHRECLPGSAVRGHTAEIAGVKPLVAGLSTMEIGLAASKVW